MYGCSSNVGSQYAWILAYESYRLLLKYTAPVLFGVKSTPYYKKIMRPLSLLLICTGQDYVSKEIKGSNTIAATGSLS